MYKRQRYNKFGFDFYLVDTAGIRKKNKVNEDLEYYSVVRSIRAIDVYKRQVGVSSCREVSA